LTVSAPFLTRIAGIINILVYVIVFSSLFSILCDTVFSLSGSDLQSVTILYFIIVIDIVLLIANYAIYLRIISGKWTINLPESIEPQKTGVKFFILDAKVYWFLLIWIISMIALLHPSIWGGLVNPEEILSFYVIIWLIGGGAGILFCLIIIPNLKQI